ncbi:MAG: sulfur carrier protein ThiS [Planctomycetaceae bacterium]|nr:sulfur carrier protein ThiS [Planctomycetota bacterium]NUN52603.1 sulfur carrier protein ThiS [Planctomycetaceae bacterium]
MKVLLNGAEREVPDGTTVLALLEQAGIDRRRCAVELNREVVPKASHGARTLAAGDRVEIVTMVGGG